MLRTLVAHRRIAALIAVASFLVVAAPMAAQAQSGDSDGDGYSDSSDYCPSQPGGAGGPYNQPGCPVPPDSDGDGYIGNQDYCPSQPGGAQGPYNAPGCPVPPDSDADGYPDPQDGCPTTPGGAAGPANAQGCPVPATAAETDRDGDGVSNEYDDCPDTAGSRDVEGCPDQDGDGLRDSADACPNQKGPTNGDGQAIGGGCPDADRDGVRDTEDECPNQGKGTYAGGVRKMDDKGCPIASAFFNFPSGDTWEMGHGAGMIAICNNVPHMADCTWRIHVSLTEDSADKLGLKNRELVDRKVTTSGKSNFFQQVRGNWRWRPSAALTAALKKYGRSVTVILTGSYKVEGSGDWKRMDRDKRVIKPKRCGWVPYTCT